MIIRLFLICLIPFIIFPGTSSNTYGQLGYLNTSCLHSKRILNSLDISRLDPDRKINLTLSPLDRLDATVFYVDIATNLIQGAFKQSYKDKGFNVKYKLIENSNFAVSIGLNDFAGTSIYGSEYLVFSHLVGKLDYSLELDGVFIVMEYMLIILFQV